MSGKEIRKKRQFVLWSESIFVHPYSYVIWPFVGDRDISESRLRLLCCAVVVFHQTQTFRAICMNMPLSVSSVLRAVDEVSDLPRACFPLKKYVYGWFFQWLQTISYSWFAYWSVWLFSCSPNHIVLMAFPVEFSVLVPSPTLSGSL